MDLTAALAVTWTDDAGAEQVPLRPGEFFFQLKSHVPMGAVVGGGETTFRLFAPRARQVRLHLSASLRARRPRWFTTWTGGATAAWEARLDGNLHGWYYWYTVDGPQEMPSACSIGSQRILDPYALAAVGREGPGIVIDRPEMAQPDRSFRRPPGRTW